MRETPLEHKKFGLRPTARMEIDTMNTASEKKITRVDALNEALTLMENSTLPRKDEFVQKLKDIITSFEKKSSSSKPTPRQLANDGLKKAIYAYMAQSPNQRFTVSELMKNVPGLPEEITNQWMTALLHQMYDKENPTNPAFPIVRSESKGRAYFQVNPAYVPVNEEMGE